MGPQLGIQQITYFGVYKLGIRLKVTDSFKGLASAEEVLGVT
jgi:hypothetical protein